MGARCEPCYTLLMRNLITDVPGVRVGNASDARLASGATVVVFDQPYDAPAAGEAAVRQPPRVFADGQLVNVSGSVPSLQKVGWDDKDLAKMGYSGANKSDTPRTVATTPPATTIIRSSAFSATRIMLAPGSLAAPMRCARTAGASLSTGRNACSQIAALACCLL